jgi:predicted nucleic acid-binding protein
MTVTSTSRRDVFVDTSAFYAIRDTDDAHHASAVAAFGRLRQERILLVTTDHVVSESAMLIRPRLGFDVVRLFFVSVQQSRAAGLMQLYYPVWEDLEAAITEYLSWGNPRFSFVDALSFVICRRNGIGRVLAYDDDFRVAGFELVSA